MSLHIDAQFPICDDYLRLSSLLVPHERMSQRSKKKKKLLSHTFSCFALPPTPSQQHVPTIEAPLNHPHIPTPSPSPFHSHISLIALSSVTLEDALICAIWRHVANFRQTGSIVSHHFETSTARQILSSHAIQIHSVT